MAVEKRNNRGAHTDSSYHSRTWQCTTKHRVSVRTDIGPTRSLKTVYGSRTEKQPGNAWAANISPRRDFGLMHDETEANYDQFSRPAVQSFQSPTLAWVTASVQLLELEVRPCQPTLLHNSLSTCIPRGAAPRLPRLPRSP